MFAIAFDMDIKELRSTYGEPYNNAYYEIKIILRKLQKKCQILAIFKDLS